MLACQLTTYRNQTKVGMQCVSKDAEQGLCAGQRAHAASSYALLAGCLLPFHSPAIHVPCNHLTMEHHVGGCPCSRARNGSAEGFARLTVTSVRATRSGMSLVLSLCTMRAMLFQSSLSLNGSHSVCMHNAQLQGSRQFPPNWQVWQHRQGMQHVL